MPNVFDQFDGQESQQTGANVFDQFDEKPEGFGARLSREIKDVPRQLGLTGRYLAEGLGGTADLIAYPVRAALNAAGMNIQGNTGEAVADIVGLPKPETQIERLVSGPSKVLAGSGGAIGLARGAAALMQPGVAQSAFQAITKRPDVQASSAVGAGAAGEYVKETGGDPWAQFMASLAGGLSGPAAVGTTQRIGAGLKNLIDKPGFNAQIDVTINNVLKSSGMTLDDIPMNIRDQLRDDVKRVLKTGEVSPDVLRRLADYRSVGATPTVGGVTLDPVAITQQRNLASMGANSLDPKLQTISRIENQNARALIEGLNRLGADTADDAFSAGAKAISALEGKKAAAKSSIDALYGQARGTAGRSAALDPSAFTNKAANLLDDALLGGKVPADVRNKLNQIAEGKMPFTVDVSEQLKTRLGELQRASADAAERKALGLVRQALEDTPLLEGQGQLAIDAFNKARAANKAWMQIVEGTPALKAVVEGVEPDKFVQQFVIGSGKDASTKSVFALRNALEGNPEAQGALRNTVAQFLKTKAMGGSPDEAAKFSQSAYNNALQSIGDRKLAMFFSPQELQQLKAIGRVALYEQVQPRGSAVNNSRTAGALVATMLDKLGSSPVLRGVPFGAQAVGDPMKSVAVRMQAKQALDLEKALALQAQKEKQLLVGPILAPLISD